MLTANLFLLSGAFFFSFFFCGWLHRQKRSPRFAKATYWIGLNSPNLFYRKPTDRKPTQVAPSWVAGSKSREEDKEDVRDTAVNLAAGISWCLPAAADLEIKCVFFFFFTPN